MAEDRKVIQPDLDFVRSVMESGGDTVKQCMQCANCSVACELSPTERPFPRKEMIWAPRMHPDGQRLAFHSGGYVSEMWVMENFLPEAVAVGGP